MSDTVTISGLPTTSEVADNTAFPTETGALTQRATASQIATYVLKSLIDFDTGALKIGTNARLMPLSNGCKLQIKNSSGAWVDHAIDIES